MEMLTFTEYLQPTTAFRTNTQKSPVNLEPWIQRKPENNQTCAIIHSGSFLFLARFQKIMYEQI